MSDKDNQYLAMVKVMAPFCLFLVSPMTAWIVYKVTMKDLESGIVIPRQTMFANILLVLVMFIGSIWGCRYALGWFKFKK